MWKLFQKSLFNNAVVQGYVWISFSNAWRLILLLWREPSVKGVQDIEKYILSQHWQKKMMNSAVVADVEVLK